MSPFTICFSFPKVATYPVESAGFEPASQGFRHAALPLIDTVSTPKIQASPIQSERLDHVNDSVSHYLLFLSSSQSERYLIAQRAAMLLHSLPGPLTL